eukprot:419730_1
MILGITIFLLLLRTLQTSARYIESKICGNLEHRFDIKYEKTFVECVEYCAYLGIKCKLFNYFHYYKATNDTRCYIFDTLCDIKTDGNANRSVIGYPMPKCRDYPMDWSDSIGDSCNFYESYHWCEGYDILKNDDEFVSLMDTKYGLTAKSKGKAIRIATNASKYI